ncbi:MAG: helix-turn-helix domain-containing protein [Deltaproteobacteria bacterium]|nr:helix-turn-helix domain-containing protein [Deltaproteobacteria bacterium]
MEHLLTPEEASQLLAIPIKTVHELCRRHVLGFVRMDNRGTRRFTMEQIQAFIQSQTVAPRIAVDTRQTKVLPSRPKPITQKGGERQTGVSTRAQLREEMRSW